MFNKLTFPVLVSRYSICNMRGTNEGINFILVANVTKLSKINVEICRAFKLFTYRVAELDPQLPEQLLTLNIFIGNIKKKPVRRIMDCESKIAIATQKQTWIRIRMKTSRICHTNYFRLIIFFLCTLFQRQSIRYQSLKIFASKFNKLCVIRLQTRYLPNILFLFFGLHICGITTR